MSIQPLWCRLALHELRVPMVLSKNKNNTQGIRKDLILKVSIAVQL